MATVTKPKVVAPKATKTVTAKTVKATAATKQRREGSPAFPASNRLSMSYLDERIDYLETLCEKLTSQLIANNIDVSAFPELEVKEEATLQDVVEALKPVKQSNKTAKTTAGRVKLEDDEDASSDDSDDNAMIDVEI